MTKIKRFPIFLLMVGLVFSSLLMGEADKRYNKLVIRNVTLIDGNGTPAKGPFDVIVKENIIQSIGFVKSEAEYQDADRVIDGTGMYLLPGLINVHAHIHDKRGDKAIPFEYLYKLWLSCGITTVRDVASNTKLTLVEREKSKNGTITAPRIFLYIVAWTRSPEEARKKVREIKQMGGDGVKIFGNDRDVLEALLDEAHKMKLRVSHHIGVEETDVSDDIQLGVTSVEHWYGVPDAALHGSQNFPYWYNYNNENDRFRYAGHLWREADPEKLEKVLQGMVRTEVGWCPTFVIYEANRDLQRAMNQPWFKNYLHPVLEEYFVPNPVNHGSYHWKWTTEDEVFWKENYRIWMKAVREFARMGGVVGVGEDAGYIYMMYGFSLIRELELHQEAGFHPIDVIQHATENNAKILGMEDKLGRIKAGYWADMILIDENPLENFKYLYPTGVKELEDGKLVRKGGVKWVIKDGFVYNAPALLEEVKSLVFEARKISKKST